MLPEGLQQSSIRRGPPRGAQVLAKELQQLAQLSLEVAELAKEWQAEGGPTDAAGSSRSFGKDAACRDALHAKLIAQLSHMVAHQAKDLAHMAAVLALEAPKTLLDEQQHAHATPQQLQHGGQHRMLDQQERQGQEQQQQQHLQQEGLHPSIAQSQQAQLAGHGFDRETVSRLARQLFRTTPFATRAQLRRMLLEYTGLPHADGLRAHLASKDGVKLGDLLDRLSSRVHNERRNALTAVRQATQRAYLGVGAFKADGQGGATRDEPTIKGLLADNSWRDSGSQRCGAGPFQSVLREYHQARVLRRQHPAGSRDAADEAGAWVATQEGAEEERVAVTLEELAFVECAVLCELAGHEGELERKQAFKRRYGQILQGLREAQLVSLPSGGVIISPSQASSGR
ncbi:hypothetical protein N2152v2_005357 [Parachlorella kessleri]